MLFKLTILNQSSYVINLWGFMTRKVKYAPYFFDIQ